jgi:hypothetical protein
MIGQSPPVARLAGFFMVRPQQEVASGFELNRKQGDKPRE